MPPSCIFCYFFLFQFPWTITVDTVVHIFSFQDALTHLGWVTYICVGNLTIIGTDNGLSPCRRQAFIWTSVGILLIGHLGTNLSEITIETPHFQSRKCVSKCPSSKWRPFCLGLYVLTHGGWDIGPFLQTTCSTTFPSMKIVVFWFKFN